MNRLKHWWIERKIRSRQIRELDIMRQLKITERNGKLWIVCNGVGIRQIPDIASAKEGVSMFETARKAAVEFEKNN